MALPKLTMEDVDKKLEEIRTRSRPIDRGTIKQSLLDMAAKRPRLPRLPRV